MQTMYNYVNINALKLPKQELRSGLCNTMQCHSSQRPNWSVNFFVIQCREQIDININDNCVLECLISVVSASLVVVYMDEYFFSVLKTLFFVQAKYDFWDFLLTTWFFSLFYVFTTVNTHTAVELISPTMYIPFQKFIPKLPRGKFNVMFKFKYSKYNPQGLNIFFGGRGGGAGAYTCMEAIEFSVSKVHSKAPRD